MTDVAAQPTPRLSDRYLLGDVLGIGGTATVYRAVHRASGRAVAVKVYAYGLVGRDALPSHGAETAALTDLRHPGLVEIYESGFDGDCAYLVMRLIEGQSLTDRIRQGPLPVSDMVELGAALADALAHVHAHGVVHRDVKPSNIMLDAQLVPFLTDFGVSRLIDATRRTATGVIVGTPAFMAPEQVRGQPVGPPTDIYALGLVLLEASTGQREYPGDVVESAIARLHRDPVVPTGLPEPYRRLLGEMTAQQPAARPTAAAVATRLRGVIGGPHRVTQRRGVVVSTAAALVLLAGAAIGVVSLDTPTATAPPTSETPSAVPTQQPPSTGSAATAGSPTDVATSRPAPIPPPTVPPRSVGAANSAQPADPPAPAPLRSASPEQTEPIPAAASGNARQKEDNSDSKKPKKDKKR